MLPFEFVATATASPRYSPGGSLRKFATVVNGISGTPVTVAFACANAGPAASVRTAHAEARIRVIERPLSRGERIPAPPVVQRFTVRPARYRESSQPGSVRRRD